MSIDQRGARARRSLALLVGCTLVLVGCGGEADNNTVPTSAPVLTTAPSEFTTTTTTIPPGPVLYEIQAGDTLSGIADQFGITLAQLMQANPTITDAGLISVGQTILIPEIVPAAGEDGGGLELPDPEAPDLPSLTSTTTTTEPLATTSTAAP